MERISALQSFSTDAAMQFPKQQVFTQQFLIALRI